MGFLGMRIRRVSLRCCRKVHMRLLVVFVYATLLGLPSFSMHAGDSRELDRDHVIAQMVMNFPLVTTWPISHTAADGKIRLCTLSEHAVGRDVMTMVSASKAAAQYRFVGNVKDDGVAGCHVLMVSAQDNARWQSLQAKVSKLPILTVGTDKNFLRKGGIIEFVVAEKNLGVFSEHNVRFDIHMPHARTAGLTLDPMLLELAEHIVME